MTLEFSRYVYKAYGETLSREVFQVPSHELSPAWLDYQKDLLLDDQELALHSRVRLKGEKSVYHIPMIDFINTKSAARIIDRLSTVDNEFSESVSLYRSGNSFHGYYYQLIPEHNWYKFLGKILLCNLPTMYEREVVDSRWVGHSLIHGFSALRWSRHTDLYKQEPRLVARPTTSLKSPTFFDSD